MEKELVLKTKQIELTDTDIQHKRKSMELLELQIEQLRRELYGSGSQKITQDPTGLTYQNLF